MINASLPGEVAGATVRRLGEGVGGARRGLTPTGQWGACRMRAGGHTAPMAFAPPVRHLLRAKDLADARYAEPLTVADLARAAGCRARTSAASFAALSVSRRTRTC